MSSRSGIAPAWQTERLGRLAQVKGGKRLPKGEKLHREPTPFPYIRVCDFNAFSVDVSDIHYLTPAVQERIRRYIITKDDVFVSIAGTIGLVGTIPESLDGANLTENAARVVLGNRGSLDKEFLKFCLASPDIQSDIASRRSKNAQPKLALAQIKDLEIPLPPLTEQKKIAHILSTVQRAIEEQERIIQTTTELKKALMHKLFTEGLPDKAGRRQKQKQTEIGPVPQSWEVVALGELISAAQYGMSVKGNPAGNYPILRMTNQVNGRVVANNLQFVEITDSEFQKFKVERGDILFNRTNSLDLVGRTAIHDIGGDYVFASYLIRVQTKEERLNPFFLNLDFNRDETQVRLKSIATRAVSQSNISATRLKGFPVPLPSLTDQAEIVRRGAALDSKIELYHAKLTALQDLFRTLLHELMNAKLRVHKLELSS